MVKFDTESKIPKRRSRIKLLLLFSFTFAVTFFLLGTIIRNFSPPIDVNIGNEEIASVENIDDFDEIDDFEEGEVDSRLKWIQYEDNNPDVNSIDNTANSEDIEEMNNHKNIPAVYKKKQTKITTKSTTTKSVSKLNHPNKYIMTQDVSLSSTLAEPADINAEKNLSHKSNIVNSKVYVGYYPTKEHALKALNSINSTIPGFNPFVRILNGQYIVQVGSFTDKGKAMHVKHELLRNGFPAKLTVQ